MSVQDFISGTFSRIDDDDEDLEDVVLDTIAEFAAGATARLWWLSVQLRGGVISTEVAGAQCRFVGESIMDVRRGYDLFDEQPVAEWLFAGDPSGELVWDVGGYHGHWSGVAAALGCRLRVFEPHPENRARLIRNLELNDVGSGHDRVTVDERALADQRAEMPFNGRSASEASLGGDSDRTVQTVTGDDVLELPDRVKIDVEGYERVVLRGMENTLAHVDRIAIEVHDGVDQRALESQLKQAGFETREIPCRRSQVYVGGWRS